MADIISFIMWHRKIKKNGISSKINNSFLMKFLALNCLCVYVLLYLQKINKQIMISRSKLACLRNKLKMLGTAAPGQCHLTTQLVSQMFPSHLKKVIIKSKLMLVVANL